MTFVPSLEPLRELLRTSGDNERKRQAAVSLLEDRPRSPHMQFCQSECTLVGILIVFRFAMHVSPADTSQDRVGPDSGVRRRELPSLQSGPQEKDGSRPRLRSEAAGSTAEAVAVEKPHRLARWREEHGLGACGVLCEPGQPGCRQCAEGEFPGEFLAICGGQHAKHVRRCCVDAESCLRRPGQDVASMHDNRICVTIQ